MRALDISYELKQKAGIVVLPPGSGKTRIAAEGAKRYSAKRILYVAHTYEILDVAKSEFEAVFDTKSVVVHESGASLEKPKRANLATIQLLARNIRNIKRGMFDYLIVDEFHHAAAMTYRVLMDKIQPGFLLGLTATPFRGDRQNILELCGDNLLVNFELRAGIECGILAPYHYWGCFDDIDYSSIRHNGIRYDIRDLEKALVIPERDAAIISKWRVRAEDKPTIAFCVSHRHASRIGESFNAEGIPAAPYLSTTTSRERARLLERFRAGKLKVLCVVDVLNEGADIPFVECLLFLRPTESHRIFYQQLGRGLRKYVGKPFCTVIDFIGNFKNAYKIVEYQDLLPIPGGEVMTALSRSHNPKEVLDLPVGCRVEFEDRVIDVFARQVLDPRTATRHNIGKILLYQYERLRKRLGRSPTKREVDRASLLDSQFYSLVFGSWERFQLIAQ